METNCKKSAIAGEYIVQVKNDGGIEVFRIYDNVKGGLKEAAESVGFEYDSNWTTRQFGAKLIKEYGSGKMANVGILLCLLLIPVALNCIVLMKIQRRH